MKKILILSSLFILTLSNAFATVAHSIYKVDTTRSTVKWTGEKLLGDSHTGFVKISKGSLKFMGREFVGGEFTLDMTSISNTDVKDPKYNKKIVGHLSSVDFFDTVNNKTAKLVIKDVTLGKGGHYDVTGKLTIRGKTNFISFKTNLTSGKKLITAKSKLVFDRTKFGVNYNSTTIPNPVKLAKDRVIKDNITIDVILYVNK